MKIPKLSLHFKCILLRQFHLTVHLYEEKIMKILNVAEKNDAAKNIASLLSNGSARRREGRSKFNKIYEFRYQVLGQTCDMMMTSVSGHMMNYDFIGVYKSWNKCSPETLFDAPLQKYCPDNFTPIKKTLEAEIKGCDALIIWTDCDREGENIGYEIIETCLAVKPRVKVYRAKFSEITSASVKRAVANLEQPNKNVSDAVAVRSELDLRIGCAFTRFQTLRLSKVFPTLSDYLLSYGPCQFPTLGFVVERYLEREKFIPEAFWKIKVTHAKDDLKVEYQWKRNRLFDQEICEAILARCLENRIALVESVVGKPKSKWRPTPLDTTEMEKIVSRKLKINAKETMKIAEKLYTQGYISYPRTETNIFPDSLNLNGLVEMQKQDSRWGSFAGKVLSEGANPRQGKKSDQSHPPIHPIKYTSELSGNEARLYEFIVRHFLACVSKDAQGHETTVTIDINGEKFSASGLMILEKNYLEVYIYESWSAKAIHLYKQGERFDPTTLEIVAGETSPPNLLTEADLIALMEKHGIGTDATHAEHIETIKTRFYVGLENTYFVPSAVGMGLVEGYDTMGFEMSKPEIRASLEADLKKICDGEKRPDDVLKEHIEKYRNLFRRAKEQVEMIDVAMSKYIGEQAQTLSSENDPTMVQLSADALGVKVMGCKSCGLDQVLKPGTNGRFYINCIGFPRCKASIWLPSNVTSAKVSNESCPKCGPGVKLIDFKFRMGSMIPYYPDEYKGCINGCDKDFIQMLGIQIITPKGAVSKTSTARNTTTTNNHVPRTTSARNPTTNNRLDDDNERRGQKRRRGDDDDEDKDDSQPPVCMCGEPSKRCTVRKEGPNCGRDFFICSKDIDGKCSFYTWADEVSSGMKCFCNLPARKMTVRKEGPNQGRQFHGCPKGYNEERCQFFLWDDDPVVGGGGSGGGWGGGGSRGGRGGGGGSRGGRGAAASRQQHQPKWCNAGGSQGNKFKGTSSSTRGKTAKTSNQQFRAKSGHSTGESKPRKCGLCGEPGHNRRNCPQNNG